MPILLSTYHPPRLLRNRHLQTIVPAFFRRSCAEKVQRERLETSDGDFLDLEWRRHGSNRLVVLTHGLEGCTASRYIHGMAAALALSGFDSVAWNMRGCSGEPNRKKAWYHSGKSEDLGEIVTHVCRAAYGEVYLAGFSVGGNITLKYLGERADAVPPKVRAAATLSVPCDLGDAARVLELPKNRVYLAWFIRQLKDKVRRKSAVMPGAFDTSCLDRIRSFTEFDTVYTAPLNGFDSASAYWEAASCRPWISRIRVPSLLVNALDDPFLGERCFPFEEAEQNSNFSFEAPSFGGHVGFISKTGQFWFEQRCGLFFLENS